MSGVSSWIRRFWWLPIAAVLIVSALVVGALGLIGVSGPHWLVAITTGAVGVLITAVGVITNQVTSHKVEHKLNRDDARTEATEAIVGLSRQLTKARDWTNWRALGIHPAIPLPGETDASLPSYVLRDVDTQVRNLIEAGIAGGTFVLLKGRAGKGKSRCLYEAMRATIPDDWRFLLPQNSSRLLDLVSAGQDLGKTVIWLDELQDYLASSPDAVLDAISRLLNDPTRPLIILATIWSTHYDRFQQAGTTWSTTADGHSHAEVGDPAARRVLRLAHVVTMPNGFDDSDALTAAGQADPRIETARQLADDEHTLTESLGAAPQLIDAFDVPSDKLAGYLAHAAVVIRRCGNSNKIGADLLRTMAEAAFTDHDRADYFDTDWFTDGIALATHAVANTSIPILTDVLETGDEAVSYSLHDLVLQHAIDCGIDTPDDGQWQLVIERANPEECFAIGHQVWDAWNGDKTALAGRAWQRSADFGNTDAMHELAHLRQTNDDIEGAEDWFRKACAARDNADAMACFGIFLDDFSRGDTGEAKIWLESAAKQGIVKAMHRLGHIAENGGDTSAADDWFRKAVDGGDKQAASCYVLVLIDRKDWTDAELWCQRAADSGDMFGASRLGLILLKTGHEADAEARWKQLGEDESNWDAMHYLADFYAGDLGDTHKDHPDLETAVGWMRKAAELGEAAEWRKLGVLLVKSGKPEEAQDWLKRGGAFEDADILKHLGNIESDAGHIPAAIDYYEKSRRLGNTYATDMLGMLLQEQGDSDAARRLFEESAKAGDALGMCLLGDDEYGRGHVSNALDWWEKAARMNQAAASFQLGKHYEHIGDIDEARKRYEAAQQAGLDLATDALRRLDSGEYLNPA